MTRIDDVRAATTGSAKEGMRNAKAVKDTVAPKVSHAAWQAQVSAQHAQQTAKHAQHSAREQYQNHVAPRLAQARESLPPALDDAASRAVGRTREAADRTRSAARHAADYAAPRLEAARAAAAPAKEEAVERSTAALAALRGEVTPAEVEKITTRRVRRARAGKAVKRLAVLGLVVGVAYGAWRWWDRQANPDWLVEPPPATEVGEELSEGSTVLDPEVRAKQDEAEASEAGVTGANDNDAKER